MKSLLPYATLLSFSLASLPLPAFAEATAFDLWQRFGQLSLEAKKAGFRESLQQGVTVGGLLAPLEKRFPSPADKRGLTQFLQAHKISRQETVKAKSVVVADGKFLVNLGGASGQTITVALGQNRQLSLNEHNLLVDSQPLTVLLAQIEKILTNPRAEQRWNWLLPSAQATPLALVGIGTLVGLAAITLFMEDPDTVAYHLKEQTDACAKEMASGHVAYASSSTKKVADDLVRRGLLSPTLQPILGTFPANGNPRSPRATRADCEAFAARAVEGESAANRRSRLKAGDVLSACKAALAFSDCAKKFLRTPAAGTGISPNETEAHPSASGAN